MSLDKKTQALNQSGAFLQFSVLTELNKRGWQSLVEVPVTVMPFVTHQSKHPLLYTRLLYDKKFESSHFPQAITESQTQFLKEETSVDIDASKIIEIEFDPPLTFRLCIEVKKNDPKYSDWCFFQLKKNSEPMRVITKTLVKQGRVTLFHVPPTFGHDDIYVQTNQFHHWDIFRHPISDFALALQSENINKDYYRSEKTKIDEAARQIIKGTYGLVIEKLIHQVTTGEGYIDSPNIFVPIIVTNANLYLCKFDPKDIDSNSGHITKDPNFEPIDSVICEYPTPKEVQFPDPLSSDLDAEKRNHVVKWHVLILTPKGFVKFLDEIDKIKHMQ